MAIQSRPQDSSLPAEVIARNHFIQLSRTLSHEFAHYAACASGARERHVSDIELEHETFVDPIGEAVFMNNYLNVDEYTVGGETTLIGRPPFPILPIQITDSRS
jgi:hypothetical protein